MTSMENKGTPWKQVIVIGFTGMFTSIQYSVYLSSMWPYLKKLDPFVDETFFGIAASTYAFAQFLFCPAFGWWSNRIKNIKIPLITSVVIECVGHLIYFCIQFAPNYARWIFVMSRLVNGIGTSNVGLMKAYACTASINEDRSAAVATVFGLFALGMTIGPLLQFMFTPIGEDGVVIIQNFLSFNMYTIPPLLSATVNIITILMLYYIFDEKYGGLAEKKGEDGNESEVKLEKIDNVGFYICFITNFAQLFMYGTIETLSTPIAMTLFALTRKRAVEIVSIVHGIRAFFDLVVNGSLAVTNLGKWINHRIACFVGFVGMGMFYVITFPYPFNSGKLVTYTREDMEAYLAGNDSEPAGCDVSSLEWCEYTHPVNFWLYYICFIVLIGMSFALVSTTLTTVFSQVIGPRRQSTQHGFLQMTGSLGRVTGPTVISYLYNHHGLYQAWGVDIAVMFGAAAIWAVTYKRLRPLGT